MYMYVYIYEAYTLYMKYTCLKYTCEQYLVQTHVMELHRYDMSSMCVHRLPRRDSRIVMFLHHGVYMCVKQREREREREHAITCVHH